MIDYSFRICKDPAYSCENGGMLSLEYKNTDSEANKKANEYVDGDVPRSPCSSAIDIASPSMVKSKNSCPNCFGDCFGEIVTNSELFARNEKNKNEVHTYPVLLDADWSSEGF
ncbi:putative [histone H3]-lysine(4) N-trimethyltransferase [Helianthus anomalus]